MAWLCCGSLARPLYPGLMVPGYRQVSGRRKDLFYSSGSLVSVSSQGMGGLHSPVGLAWTLLLDHKVFHCFDQLSLPNMHIWCLLPVLICPHWNQILIINKFYHKLQLCKDRLQRMILFYLLKEKTFLLLMIKACGSHLCSQVTHWLV